MAESHKQSAAVQAEQVKSRQKLHDAHALGRLLHSSVAGAKAQGTNVSHKQRSIAEQVTCNNIEPMYLDRLKSDDEHECPTCAYPVHQKVTSSGHS